MDRNSIDIKQLTTEKIKSLINQLTDELKSREDKPRFVVYTHNCKGASRSHLNKYKHWCKLVTGIDNTKADGYALIGKFLRVDGENMVPTGSIVVEVCGNDYTAYRITGDYEGTVVAEATRGSLHSMITAIAEVLKSDTGLANNAE